LEVGNSVLGVDLHWFDVFSRDGQFLAVGSTNGLMRIWDVRRRILSCSLTNTVSEFVPLEFLDGDQKLITGSGTENGDSLQEWDLQTGSKIQSWSASWRCACLSPNESLFASVAADMQRLVIRNLDEQKTLQFDFGVLVYRSRFSPDGSRFLVSLFPSGCFQVWDTSSWREVVSKLHGSLLSVSAMDFSPDSKRLITGGIGERALHLWDTESWQQLQLLTIESQGGTCEEVAFSSDGNTIAALDATGILQLLRAPSWAEINAAEAKEGMEVRQP